MTDSERLTAEQFAERRWDLPDAGRWTELHRGQLVHLHPPDETHGNVVYHLSKALGTYFHPDAALPGYAAFELGLRVERDPDTVRCPAACCYVGGKRFAEVDLAFTDARPALVIEIASTNDRRRSMTTRTEEYRAWGVDLLWIIDTAERCVHVVPRGKEPRVLAADQTLTGESVLAGFSQPIAPLFAEPAWYRGTNTPRRR